jgi:hypothetical protein
MTVAARTSAFSNGPADHGKGQATPTPTNKASTHAINGLP